MSEKTADEPLETARANDLDRTHCHWANAASIFYILAVACLGIACVVAFLKGNTETALFAAGALMALFMYFAVRACDILDEEKNAS